MAEWVIIILLMVGTGFMLTSSIGLTRLPDFYMRMHGPTKAATLGVICVLVAAVLHFTFARNFFSIREIIAILFIFVTAPVGAHMLSKAARATLVPFHKSTKIEAPAPTEKTPPPSRPKD